MTCVLLVHWNAPEAAARAAQLERAGYDVVTHSDRRADPRSLRSHAPDVCVIDLSRSPSQGRELGGLLRRQAATRHIPLVFAGGEPEPLARVQALLPDAVFTDWRRIRGALRQALRHPPGRPVVPGAMDGYAGAPLPRKLGLRPGVTVTLLGAPEGFEALLAPLPDAVQVQRQARGQAAVVVLFVTTRTDLERRFPAATRILAEGGRLWLAWPKQSSGAAGDLTQAAVRAFGLGAGFVDYKISALDATWSGLCFARRR